MEKKRVGIVIFDNVEVLDFCGPFEVFSVTRLSEDKRFDEPSPFEVLLIAERGDFAVTAGGMKVIPDYTFEDCPELDILIVPGGLGTRKEINNAPLLEWIRKRSAEVEVLSSVCTGSMLLGAAGLLNGLQATTHWASLDWMQDLFPAVKVVRDKQFIDVGPVITSAGISAGIDMALKLIERYCGEVVARETAKRMEYTYPDNDARRIKF